jgi:hypothetical protein
MISRKLLAEKEEMLEVITKTIEFVRTAEGYEEGFLVQTTARHIYDKLSELMEKASAERQDIPITDLSWMPQFQQGKQGAN